MRDMTFRHGGEGFEGSDGLLGCPGQEVIGSLVIGSMGCFTYLKMGYIRVKSSTDPNH